MKRSYKISFVLLGGLSAGALASCARRAEGEPRVSADSVYENNHYVTGAGYYHAPFQGFYPQPYNYYDAQRKLYYYGGQWGSAPFRSVINVSAPTPSAAETAENGRANIQRAGFGSTGGGYHVWS